MTEPTNAELAERIFKIAETTDELSDAEYRDLHLAVQRLIQPVSEEEVERAVSAYWRTSENFHKTHRDCIRTALEAARGE